MKVSKRIQERRKYLGLTADELAEKLKVNRSTIYRYESNDIEKLPVTILEPLAAALETTPAYLMGWTTKTEANNKTDILENEVIYKLNGMVVKRNLSKTQILYLDKFISSICDSTDSVQIIADSTKSVPPIKRDKPKIT